LRNVGLIVFDDTQRDDLLRVAGLKATTDGNLKEGSHKAMCKSCKTALTKENLGAVLHGSTLLYCTNTACMLDYFDQELADTQAKSVTIG
jgi:hypothetical protein